MKLIYIVLIACACIAPFQTYAARSLRRRDLSQSLSIVLEPTENSTDYDSPPPLPLNVTDPANSRVGRSTNFDSPLPLPYNASAWNLTSLNTSGFNATETTLANVNDSLSSIGSYLSSLFDPLVQLLKSAFNNLKPNSKRLHRSLIAMTRPEIKQERSVMWDEESCELIKKLHKLGVSDKTINERIKSSLEDMLNIFKGIEGQLQDQGSNWDIASAHYQDLVDDFFPFSLPAEAYNELEYEDLDSDYYFGAQDGLMYLDEETLFDDYWYGKEVAESASEAHRDDSSDSVWLTRMEVA